MSKATPNIQIYSPSNSSKALYEIWQSTTGSIPGYALPSTKFHSLISAPLARIFFSSDPKGDVQGFAITYLIRSGSESSPGGQHLKGSLAILLVDPEYRNQGVGTALHSAALDYLTDAVKSSLDKSTPRPEKWELQLGSIFPRIFPGLPEGPEFAEAKSWFERREWTFGSDLSIDLYRSLTPGQAVDTEAISRKAKEHGITFRTPRPEDVPALYELQTAHFDSYTGWPDTFPTLVNSGHADDIYCAFDKDGNMIGATVAAMAPKEGDQLAEIHELLAWPSTLGKSCAAIACVGIASSARGTGAGIAMVAEATSSLAQRGADGCFIDWVSMKGFYEKCGYKKWNRGYWGGSRSV